MTNFFTIRKTGYSAGVYACTAEYFTINVFKDGKECETYHFQGLYGVQYRASGILKANGYDCAYVGDGNWGLHCTKLNYANY